MSKSDIRAFTASIITTLVCSAFTHLSNSLNICSRYLGSLSSLKSYSLSSPVKCYIKYVVRAPENIERTCVSSVTKYSSKVKMRIFLLYFFSMRSILSAITVLPDPGNPRKIIQRNSARANRFGLENNWISVRWLVPTTFVELPVKSIVALTPAGIVGAFSCLTMATSGDICTRIGLDSSRNGVVIVVLYLGVIGELTRCKRTRLLCDPSTGERLRDSFSGLRDGLRRRAPRGLPGLRFRRVLEVLLLRRRRRLELGLPGLRLLRDRELLRLRRRRRRGLRVRLRLRLGEVFLCDELRRRLRGDFRRRFVSERFEDFFRSRLFSLERLLKYDSHIDLVTYNI